MARPLVEGSADYITQEMMQAEYGEHNLVIYPNLTILTEIYS
jgi:hypothetical protein